MHRRTVPLVVVLAVLVGGLALTVPAVLADTDDDTTSDRDVVTIDNGHDLTEQAAIDDYRTGGYAETELSQMNATLAVATDGDDVGLNDQLMPTDVRNDFVRLEYHEDFDRTLRIHIPREYWTPYTQDGVDSATSDHVADYQPVRGGEYMEIVVYVDGPAEVTLPIQKDSSLSYRAVERADGYVEAALGYSVFDGDEWTHLRGDELVTEDGYELENVNDFDDAVIQYDSAHHDVDETWLNLPGREDDADIQVVRRGDAGNETVTLIADDDNPPDIRYKPTAEFGDEESGWINDARQVPDRIEDVVGDIWPLMAGGSL